MENTTINSAEEIKNEPINFWGPFTYMTFFIFFNLIILPNIDMWLHKLFPSKNIHIRMNNYDIEMILYGSAGIFTGIIVYRIIQNTPSWFKFILIGGMYGIILGRLIIEWKLFTVPGN
ncbi:MAG: hypothetical protein H7Y00_02620 [Fimbriimonadaceae bacterium]|nr:hypothetical protein [Chitinophagales bacterium]